MPTALTPAPQENSPTFGACAPEPVQGGRASPVRAVRVPGSILRRARVTRPTWRFIGRFMGREKGRQRAASRERRDLFQRRTGFTLSWGRGPE